MTAPTPATCRARIQNGSKRRRDIPGAAVTAEEWAIARAALAAFNAAAGTDYSLAASQIPILGRIFEHPELSADDHREIVAAAFRDRWWQSLPTVLVIYGNALHFERSLAVWRRSDSGAGVERGTRLGDRIAKRAAQRDQMRAAEQAQPSRREA